MAQPTVPGLQQQLALHEWTERRSSFVHLLGLLSVPVAVLARWPTLGSEVGRRAVLVAWLFAALAAAWAISNELWLATKLMARWREHRRARAHDDPVP